MKRKNNLFFYYFYGVLLQCRIFPRHSMMDFIQFDQSEIKSVKAYWTDGRMANAILLPLLQGKMPEILQQEDDEFSQAETEMVICAAEVNPSTILPLYYAFKVRDINIDTYRKVGR